MAIDPVFLQSFAAYLQSEDHAPIASVACIRLLTVLNPSGLSLKAEGSR